MLKKTQALSVSIVIPVFNEENYLGDCLESIKNQTVKPFEVIVVDNNSTDNSVKIAKSFPFVKLIHESVPGVLAVRTKGFNVAKGQIIGRIDADTHLPKTWVHDIQKKLKNKKIAAVSGPVGFHDAPAKKIGLFFDKNIRRATWHIGARDDAVFLFGSNMAVRREAWEAIKDGMCTRKDIHEDVDIAIHLDQADFRVAFDPHLTAMTSSRRINDPTLEMIKYLKVHKNTYAIHGIQSPAVTLPMVFVMASQFGIKLVKRAYDPETKQLSFKKLREEPEIRVQPMR